MNDLDLIQQHLQKYPLMAIGDVYRLLHQSTFGGSENVSKPENAKKWLLHQVDHPPKHRASALLEGIHPQDEWVRLYVQPYLDANGQIDALLAAMVASQKTKQIDKNALLARWQIFEQAVTAQSEITKAFSAQELKLFANAHLHTNCPALPHSPAYYEAYPSFYRVINKTQAEALCASLSRDFSY